MGSTYCDCQCSDLNHTIRFNLDEDGEIYMETRLFMCVPWWKRVWLAIGYVFGSPTRRFGHYDCTLLREEDYERLMKMFVQSSDIKLRQLLAKAPKLHLVGSQNNPVNGDEE